MGPRARRAGRALSAQSRAGARRWGPGPPPPLPSPGRRSPGSGRRGTASCAPGGTGGHAAPAAGKPGASGGQRRSAPGGGLRARVAPRNRPLREGEAPPPAAHLPQRGRGPEREAGGFGQSVHPPRGPGAGAAGPPPTGERHWPGRCCANCFAGITERPRRTDRLPVCSEGSPGDGAGKLWGEGLNPDTPGTPSRRVSADPTRAPTVCLEKPKPPVKRGAGSI